MSNVALAAEVMVGNVWTDLTQYMMWAHPNVGLERPRGNRSAIGKCDFVFVNNTQQTPATVTGAPTTTLEVRRRIRLKATGPSMTSQVLTATHSGLANTAYFSQAVTVALVNTDNIKVTWQARAQFDSIYNQDAVSLTAGSNTITANFTYTNKWNTYSLNLPITSSASSVTIQFKTLLSGNNANSSRIDYRIFTLSKNNGPQLFPTNNLMALWTATNPAGSTITLATISDYKIIFNGIIDAVSPAAHKIAGQLVTIVNAKDLTELLNRQMIDLPLQKSQTADQLMATLAATLYDGSYRATQLTDSPTRYYRLGEASGTNAADSGGNGIAGTYTGGVTLGTAGPLVGDASTATTFNGTTGYVSIPTIPLNAASFSVEAWINLADLAAIYAIFGTGTTLTLNQTFVFYTQTDGSLRAFFEGAELTSGGSALVAGKWYHVAVTYDNSTNTTTLYINGASAGSTTGIGPLAAASVPTTIGAYNAGASAFFKGTISEVSIYLNSLAASDVLRHYNAGQGNFHVMRIPGTQFAPGLTTFDRAFDTYTKDKVSAYDAINDVTNSGYGTQWFDLDGTLRYADRDYVPKLIVQSPALTIADGQAILLDQVTRASDVMRNRIEFSYHPRQTVITNTVLGQITNPITLPPQKDGGTPSKTTITLTFKDATGNTIGGDNLITPLVATTDYLVFDNATGTGFNYTTDTPVFWIDTYVPSASQLTMTLYNRATGPLYVTLLQVRGTGVLTYNPVTVTVQDADSIAAYAPRVYSKDLPFTNDQNFISSLAGYYLTQYKTPFLEARQLSSDFKTQIGNTDLMTVELMSAVSVSDAQTGLSNTLHMIDSIDYAFGTSAGNYLVKSIYSLERIDSAAYWILGNAAYSLLGNTTRLYI